MLKVKDGDSIFLNIDEARQLLGLGKTSTKVYSIIKNNVQYIKMGRRWDISRESLYIYINDLLRNSTRK